MKRALVKDSVKQIKNRLKRFISILMMAFLGVGFFAGIKATSPDMIDTIDRYYKEQNIYDLEIVSTLGLTNDDLNEIAKILAKVTNQMEREIYVDKIAKEYKISKEAIYAEVNKLMYKDNQGSKKLEKSVVTMVPKEEKENKDR